MTSLYQRLPLQQRWDVRLLYLIPANNKQPITALLNIVSLDNKPEYIALSYAWGKPIFDAELVCNGVTLEITSNLHAALMRMRRTHQSAFWVDQLCINQSDLVELGRQVALIRQIYRSAKNVYIWLGPHTEHTMNGIQVAKRLAANEPFSSFISTAKSRVLPDIPFHQQEAKLGFYELYESSLFTRCWVIQEAASNPDALAFFGDYECAWRDLAAAAAREKEHTSDKLRADLGAGRPMVASKRGQINCLSIAFIFGGIECHINNAIARQMQKSAFGKLTARGSDPLIIVASGDLFEVTDSRDRIYALIGLIDENNYGLTPDYTLPIEDIYCQFTKRCIASGTGLRLISTFAGAAIRVTAGLPSWCMDFGPGRDDALPFNEVAEAQSRSFATASEVPNCLMIQNGQQDSLRLQGVFVDTITALGPLQDKDGIWPGTLLEWLQVSIQTAVANSDIDQKEEQSIKEEKADKVTKKLIRLLVADAPAYRETAFTTFLKYKHHMDRTQEAVRITQNSSIAGLPRLLAEMTAENEWWNDSFILDVHRTTRLRRLCITSPLSKGLMGLVHGKTEVSDQVWILPGANVPVILRPCSSIADGSQGCPNLQTFELIGDAFVFGIMDGEAVQEDWFRPEQIVLC